jgi:hypothetical protein
MSPIYKGLAPAVGLIFTACLHEKNQPYCQLGLASFRKLLHLYNGFRATHYFYYGVQNHSLPTKFWNKDQRTFEYSFRTTYLKRKKLLV